MSHPEKHKEFMLWFKKESEKHFDELELDMDAYGFQFQNGTKWNEGLSELRIESIQKELGFEFPEELKWFYKTMNGTNLHGINIYGNSGIDYQYEPNFYSLTEHLNEIKGLIAEVLKMKGISYSQMKSSKIPFLFPLERFYFMVIDNQTNPICYLSTGYEMHDLNKPIVYGSFYADSLQSYLEKSVLNRTTHINDIEEFPNRKRKLNYWITDNN